MKILLPSAFAAITILSLSPARAHHGQEFFLLYDARVQAPVHGILQGNFSFIDEGTEDNIGLSPSFSLGILPRTAFNLRANFTDDAGEDQAYRSIEPGFQFDLTPPNLQLPVRFGLSVAYQFTHGSGGSHAGGSHDLSGGPMAYVHDNKPSASHDSSHNHGSSPASTETAHDHSTHEHTPPVAPPGVDSGPDALTPEEIAAMEARNAAVNTPSAAAPAPAKRKSKSFAKPKASAHPDHSSHDPAAESAHSNSGSIHNHDDNLFTARLIFEADLTLNTLLVGNLISVLPKGGGATWGYAIGLRQRLRPGLAIGVEALGDFDWNQHQEVLGAVFWEPMHQVLLKLGIGTGLTATSPDATLRAGVLWMF